MARSNNIGSVLSIIILVVIIYLIYITYNNSNVVESSLRISVNEAKARRFGLIIDVRSPLDRELLGYYPNSIPFSIQKLEQHVPLDIANKNTWILVYSNGEGDKKAEITSKILYKKGYRNVRYIKESYLSLMP